MTSLIRDENSEEVQLNFFEKALEKDNVLRQKFNSKVPTGWSGINLCSPTPHTWFDVIEEFLEYVETKCPNFEILQIKIKFGGLRMYLNNISLDVHKEVVALEKLLFDKKLIY